MVPAEQNIYENIMLVISFTSINLDAIGGLITLVCSFMYCAIA